jgi:phage tail sheath gpL-like
MPAHSINSDLPLSWRKHGVYVQINANSPGAGTNNIAKRLLLLGERNSSGAQFGANAVYQATSEQDVIDNSGRGSTVHLEYLAALSQVGGGVIDTFVGHVDEASAGTAAIWPFVVSGTATGAGQLDLYVAGRKASVGFVSGDTAATIAGLLEDELDLLTDLPVVFNVSTATITGTHRHKAAHGEDVPFMVYVTPGKGIKIGPGDAVFNTSATGAGSVRITNGTTTITAALSGGEAAADVAAALNTAINLTDGPFTSSVSTVTLSVFYANNKVIRRTSAKVITSTGTTINWNGAGAIAAGTEAPAGTVGLGSPTLTTLLSNIAAQKPGYGRWVSPWSDVTTLGTLATHIELYSDGTRLRNQVLHTCSTTALATAGAIPTGTTPALTSSMRYAVHWFADAPQLGFEYSARTAAARAGNDRPARNWDGYALKTTTSVPLLAPPLGQRSLDTDINAAINTYFLSPLTYSDATGKTVIEFGRTASNSSDRVLHDWSCIDQLDKQRARLVDDGTARFFSEEGGTSYVVSGVPFSEGVVDTDAIEDWVYEETVDFEREGFFNGADAVKDGIRATPNIADPARIDVVYTATVIVPIHQLSIVANRGSAAQ